MGLGWLMALKYCHCATQKVAKFRMQLNVAGGDKRDTLPRHYLCPCKVKAWRGKKGEMLPLLSFLLPTPFLFALLSILPSLCPVGAWDWIGAVLNCTMGMFWRCYHFFHWPLRRCARGTGSNTPIKIPYNEIRHNAHPISSTTSKQPTPASPLELENLFMG